MAIKKSELYSSLWKSCDALRGGMDASQYKDYVLTMLFVKYVSDKYANKPNSEILVPEGATFDDMVALKGTKDIGEKINTEVLKPLFAANGLDGSIELVDFNDDEKLGKDKEKVELLSKLIAIFENPALNFKNNRAEDDDILGDAYEFLMRHFATESGKSKGQFYTPSEVSTVLAKVLQVDQLDRSDYSIYDPTCGSGSLLLKVADEAPAKISIYGQEKDNATKGLAVMNMWLHGYPAESEIVGRNTLASPHWKVDGKLKRFDRVVANPPFSLKNWSTGLNTSDDEFNRFAGYGVPPEKNGDYAFLLHILASLKSKGKGAIILPHGVLFRGNAEADIRKNLIQRKLIKGIIGFPANLFYGTGIPACILLIDKENTENRKGIFMIDASKGFLKDGNKNRLREQDVHQIVDCFNLQLKIEKYSRLVPFKEIEDNEYNLNIPRYIDTQEAEDLQDLTAHLQGGIPQKDIDGLAEYWTVYPTLRKELLEEVRKDYSQLKVHKTEIKDSIFKHQEFKEYQEGVDLLFQKFEEDNKATLYGICENDSPKELIAKLGESLLSTYANKALINRYSIYQHLQDYWKETLKDDVYLIIEDGWQAKVRRILEKNSKGKEVDKGWTCDLISKGLVIDIYFSELQVEINDLEGEIESGQAEIQNLQEEHAGEEGLLADATTDAGKLSKASVTKQLKAVKGDKTEAEAIELMQQVLDLFEKDAKLKKQLKAKQLELEKVLIPQFAKLTEAEVQDLVINHKWLNTLKLKIDGETNAISQRLAQRITELAERYEHTLTELNTNTQELESKVMQHLQKMGLSWK
jgi:type I restriction enzyme M protein